MGNLNVWMCGVSAACAGMALASLASASVDGVMGQFDELSASFDSSSGRLVISAVNTTLMQSAGWVSEMRSPGRTALFGAGFVAEPNPSSVDAVFTLTNIGETSAEVTGELIVTDVDGDTLTMGVDRQPIYFGQGDGNVVTVTWWVAIESDEALFDGPDGGQVPTGFDVNSAMLSLYIMRGPRDGSGLFHVSFDDAEAVTLFAIPSPGGAGLVLLAGAAAARRRR